jgi:hypothetical protein
VAVDWMICGKMLKQSMYFEDQQNPTNYCTLGIGHELPCSFHKPTMKMVRLLYFDSPLTSAELEKIIDREVAIPLHMIRKYHAVSN